MLSALSTLNTLTSHAGHLCSPSLCSLNFRRLNKKQVCETSESSDIFVTYEETEDAVSEETGDAPLLDASSLCIIAPDASSVRDALSLFTVSSEGGLFFFLEFSFLAFFFSHRLLNLLAS